MAHISKFNKASSGRLCCHYEREGSYEKEHIDNSLTHLNYNLAPEGNKERLNQRLDELYVMNRKDVKVLADCVVTLPKDVLEQDRGKFFKETYEFLKDRYGGEKNVVSAYVHMDEKTPHMHFAFVPVAWDDKRQREKVYAKGVLNKQDFKTLHIDLDNHITKKLGYQVEIMNEKTKKGNKTVAELKKETLYEQNREIDKKLESLDKARSLIYEVEEAQKSIKSVPFTNKVLIDKDTFNKIQKSALYGAELDVNLSRKEYEYNNIKQYTTSVKNSLERHIKENKEMRSKLVSVKNERDKYKKDLVNLNKAISRSGLSSIIEKALKEVNKELGRNKNGIEKTIERVRIFER